MRSVPVESSPRPFARIWNFLPWFAAGAFALGAAWLGQRYLALQTEVEALRAQNELITIALRSAEQQLEAERIIGRWQLSDAKQQLDRASATPRMDNPEPTRATR